MPNTTFTTTTSSTSVYQNHFMTWTEEQITMTKEHAARLKIEAQQRLELVHQCVAAICSEEGKFAGVSMTKDGVIRFLVLTGRLPNNSWGNVETAFGPTISNWLMNNDMSGYSAQRLAKAMIEHAQRDLEKAKVLYDATS